MDKKFDLKRMRLEIKEDEKIAPRAAHKITQVEIRERVMKKRKEAKGER